jgi:galacturan 1,4-alpha-galacturonidase
VPVTGLSIKNPPVVFISLGDDSSDITFSNPVMMAVSKSSYAPKNTDGFDVGEYQNVVIRDVYVANQDNCVAFKAAANDVTMTNIVCDGSHGLSVGFLAKYPDHIDTAIDVYIRNATMRNSPKAAGIKIYPGGTAHGTAVVSNATLKDIVVDNCDYEFQYCACYIADETYCEENPSAAHFIDIQLKNLSGTTSSRYAPTVAEVFCPIQGSDCVTYPWRSGLSLLQPQHPIFYVITLIQTPYGFLASRQLSVSA